MIQKGLAQIVREFIAAVSIELPARPLERLSRQVTNVEEECRRLQYEVAQYRDRSNAIYAAEHGECWAWIPNDETGDENHLETLTCPVLIPAEWLRNLSEEAAHGASAMREAITDIYNLLSDSLPTGTLSEEQSRYVGFVTGILGIIDKVLSSNVGRVTPEHIKEMEQAEAEGEAARDAAVYEARRSEIADALGKGNARAASLKFLAPYLAEENPVAKLAKMWINATARVETERDAAVARAARLREVVDALEWMEFLVEDGNAKLGIGRVVVCPWCRQTNEQGHSADCIIGQALADGADGVSAKAVFELVGALRGLVGDTGLHYDNCECDNTHEQNGTVCLYCHARDMLAKYDLHT